MTGRTIGAALVVWLLAGLAAAQPLPPGQKASLGNVNAAAIVNSFNTTTITVQVQATWVGTITFEGSLDGAKYEPLLCTPIGSTTQTTTTSANGVWSCNVISVNFAQARMSAYTSGAATVSFMTAYVGGGAGSSGGGGGGNVTIVQGGNTATVNGSNQLLVNCGNCTGSGVSVPEDSVANNGDNVATAGAVRSDTLTLTTSTNGDYTWLKTDQLGALWTNPYSVTPAPGTYQVFRQTDGVNFLTPSVDYTHNTALTPASTAGPAIICRSSTATPGATTADDYASVFWCNRNGALNVGVVSGVNVAQGSVTAGQNGPIVQAAVTTAAPAYTNLQTSPLSLTPAGNLRVDGSTVTQPVSGTVTANAGTNLNTSALALDATLTTRLPAALGAGGGIKVDGSGTALPVSGTVALSNSFLLDATFTGRLPAGSTPANGESNAITTSRIGGYNFIFNGATWDRWTGAVTVAAPTTVLNGVRTVTTAGTRVTLTAGSTTAKGVTIKALVANTGVIYVGSNTVSAANGFALQPGDTVTLTIADLQTVNLDSSVNGEGVSYAGVN